MYSKLVYFFIILNLFYMNFLKQTINKNMSTIDKCSKNINPLMEKLLGKLKKEGVITKPEVYEALCQADRGDFSDNLNYAYVDRYLNL